MMPCGNSQEFEYPTIIQINKSGSAHFG